MDSTLFFQDPEISSSDYSASKEKSLKQATEEHPLKTPSIQTSHGIVTLKITRLKRDIQSSWTTRTEAKSLIETETERSHTKADETITSI